MSCGLKNIFGSIAVPRKIAYHPHLNEVIENIKINGVEDLTKFSKIFPKKTTLFSTHCGD